MIKLSNYTLQAKTAEEKLNKWLEELKEQGYKEEAPNYWVKRNANGEVISEVMP